MFKKPFSFDGRIRRLEYGLTHIINAILSTFLKLIIIGIAQNSDNNTLPFFLFLSYVPFMWFGLAQSVKRSHDLGKSGWWVLVPFYGLWLLFAEGNKGPNKYGEDPKII